MGFFLNNIYSIWKLHFWRFPEMFCHQQKVVDHQSGQAKNKKTFFQKKWKFRFWISGKPQKWSFQREYNINIQFLIVKISFQLKKWKFWKKYLKKIKIWPKSEIFIFAWSLWWPTTFFWWQNISGKPQKWSFQIA